MRAGINDVQELSKTHEAIAKAKTEIRHRILTHYLPLHANLAAFTLHQAAERLYHSVMLTLTLYSPKSHRLKALRSSAEDLDRRLIDAWPWDNRIARRRFELLSRAYVEARYSASYEITKEELNWLVERVRVLQNLVEIICREALDSEENG